MRTSLTHLLVTFAGLSAWTIAAQTQDLPQVANATKFSEPKLIPTIVDDQPFDVEAVDMDNDGDLDLVWNTNATGAVMWNENLGGGEFALAQVIDYNTGSKRALTIGDLNGDGISDVVAGSNSADDIKVYAIQGGEIIEVVQVAQGHYNTAFLTSDNEVVVVGKDSDGALEVPSFDTTVVSIQAHASWAFSARLADGEVVSWGFPGCGTRNDPWMTSMAQYKQPRDYAIGLTPDSTLSHIGCANCGIQNVPTDSNFVGIWTSEWANYWAGAIREDGSVVMWGCESDGNLTPPEGMGAVHSADGGHYWSLALLEDGSIEAWGRDDYGVVSNKPELIDVVAISAGYFHGLALQSDGTLHSWGFEGDYGLQSLPSFDGPVVKIGTGVYSSWAITESGRLYLWGADFDGMTTDAEALYAQLQSNNDFASLTVYEGTDVHALDLADFDGDGDLDVLSGGCGDQDVAWYANDGSAGFDGSRNLLAQDIGCVRGVLAVDIDVDGDPDVVTYTSNGQLSWFENISQGNFGPQQLITSWGGGWDVESADLNNDGNPDLVIKDRYGCFQWHKNPGPVGDWTFQQEQCPPTGYDTQRAFVLADVIGDDGLDVVTSAGQHGDASLEISVNRNGYFDETYSAVNLETFTAGLRGLTAADLDGDGDMDLVVTDWDGDRVFWLAQEPSTAPTAARESIDSQAEALLGLAYGDVDGDGDMDLVAADHVKDHVELYLNEDGAFVGPATLSEVDAYRLEMADINGDGHLDVLVAGGESDRVEYIPGNGDGTFGEAVVISDQTNTVWGVSAADLDNDGDLDVVSASRDDDKFAWYKNLGDGNFGPQQILTILIDQPFDVATSDVDSDGDMDIVGITIEGGDRLVWFENQGGGLFSQYAQIAGMGGDPYKLHMADLNGDGTEDALVANESTDRVSYWPNLGGGTWGNEVVITRFADGCQSVYAADMDGDGDLDVVSASYNDDKVAWYENLGDGTFGMQQPFTTGRVGVFSAYTRGDAYRSVVAFDADGDGDVEVIAGAQSGGIDLFGNLTDEPLGCGEETACNYEPEVTALYGCQFDCYGCTQENAGNYNPTSTIDDGSCLIPVDGCSNVSGIYSLCTDNNVDTVITYCPDEPENAIQMYILSGALENLADYLYVYDGADTTAALIGEPLTDQLNDNLFQATNPSGCLTIRVVTDISLGCTDGFFNPIKYILSCGYEAYLGCTDLSACNYNPDAVIDDGTCAEVDCQGICGGGAVLDDVCGVCVDVNSLIDDSTSFSSLESAVTLSADTIRFEYTDQIETWTVPNNVVLLQIEAIGAKGGNGNGNHEGGYGVKMQGWFDATGFEELQILVGEAGLDFGGYGSGGGGSFVVAGDVPLIVAGGGGGAGNNGGSNASTELFGTSGSGCGGQGELGFQGVDCQGLGFAGYGFFDGFANGGRVEFTDTFGGGSMGGNYCCNTNGGGGGGYSGGNGDYGCCGGGAGGGGSFNAGFNQLNVAGVGMGHGSVTIIVYTVVGSNCQPGCLDEGACNYDPLAAEEDGSCEYGTCAGCDDEGACNYDATVTISDPEACEYFTCLGCLDEEACNYDETATLDAQDCIYAGEVRDCDDNCYNDADGDGVCDEEEVFGCTYPQADNFNPLATEEDGTCTFGGDPNTYGCVYETACNYNQAATADDGSCVYAEEGYDCDGQCLFDSDNDGICNQFEGCTNTLACNYDPQALDNDGTCVFPPVGYDCEGGCLFDSDGDGICDNFEFPGCTDEEACNYYEGATDDDGSCVYPEYGYDCAGYCLGDVDNDGVCDLNEIEGCTIEEACNFNPEATDNDGSCDLPPAFFTCDGNCISDEDGDGICDELEILGCTYIQADNYNPEATEDDGTCTFDETFDIVGCTEPSACNYLEFATLNDGSCEFAECGYDCDGACLEDTDGDGICDAFEIGGCTDEMACNFRGNATDDDGSCLYASVEYDCDGACLEDTDGDGICDAFEVEGCTDPAANNYDENSTEDDGTCAYDTVGCTYPLADNYNPQATVDDGSCTFEEMVGVDGCTEPTACNFDMIATLNDGTCTFAEPGYDCEGNCLEDSDGDGICDLYDATCDGDDYCGVGTVWDSSSEMCVPVDTCPADLNVDGAVNTGDLLELLTVFGDDCD